MGGDDLSIKIRACQCECRPQRRAQQKEYDDQIFGAGRRQTVDEGEVKILMAPRMLGFILRGSHSGSTPLRVVLEVESRQR